MASEEEKIYNILQDIQKLPAKSGNDVLNDYAEPLSKMAADIKKYPCRLTKRNFDSIATIAATSPVPALRFWFTMILGRTMRIKPDYKNETIGILTEILLKDTDSFSLDKETMAVSDAAGTFVNILKGGPIVIQTLAALSRNSDEHIEIREKALQKLGYIAAQRTPWKNRIIDEMRSFAGNKTMPQSLRHKTIMALERMVISDKETYISLTQTFDRIVQDEKNPPQIRSLAKNAQLYLSGNHRHKSFS